MTEEDQPNPVEDIENIYNTDADFLTAPDKAQRLIVIGSLKVAYQKALMNVQGDPELSYTAAIATWHNHKQNNPDSPPLFTDEEQKRIKQYFDEVDAKIFPKEDEKKKRLDSMLSFLDKPED